MERQNTRVRNALLVLAVLVGAVTVAAAERATFTIQHDKRWPEHDKAIAVRAGGGPWRRARPSSTIGPFAIPMKANSAAVVFEVLTGSRKQPMRRLAAIVPGTKYQVTGNPCAHWGLDIVDLAAQTGDETERVRIDARALPASAFPIEIEAALMGETVVLDKPGVSAPIELAVSAMCPRSGSQVIVRSGGKAIFDESLIAHPGRLHTIRFAKRASFTLVIE